MSANRVLVLAEPGLLDQLGVVGDVVIGVDPASGSDAGHVVYAVLVEPDVCYCGEADCMHFQVGYPFCRPCDEHHRPPECAIDEHGRALNWEGTPWEELP